MLRVLVLIRVTRGLCSMSIWGVFSRSFFWTYLTMVLFPLFHKFSFFTNTQGVCIILLIEEGKSKYKGTPHVTNATGVKVVPEAKGNGMLGQKRENTTRLTIPSSPDQQQGDQHLQIPDRGHNEQSR